mmetsp:Transcript_12233/g.20266  ORF Transcript_12233/g.20266 Transcript_12233/m.20266 type:complete len:642 (-) Transcript_12233:155-2080(-)|eukprot:CAMPEP_0119025364 /NCGR_PEP_ID=MMETSP1176-20130426/33595_1 /TAXON_ID=265551 /ORGANISM="Synedropsis recta cf, Strain CCMP1620" /LENGTH=641 /DNA_ID=CAMNT_0006980893 /DNA_START=3 /DNA_END=1928 /DNA_ORIENTATION=+
MKKQVAFDQLKSTAWSHLPPMQSQREGGAAVAINGSKILVVGGYHAEKKFLKSCAVFDVSTKEWSDYPPMKTSRMGCAAVYLEQHNAVVVVGGFQRGRKYLNTVEYLDLSTLHWHRLPPMQNPRAGCAAVTVLGKRVVVLGGWMDGETAAGTVEVLDFNAQQWHSLPDMATPRAGCSAAALGHRVFVLGGHTTTGKHRGCRASVEVLDLSSQKWSRIPSMKEKRDASASCVVGNCVIVLGGGETSTSPTSSVEILDMEKMEWRELTKMRSKRFGCSAAAVGNKIVVLGGRGEDGKHLETVECMQIPLQEDVPATGTGLGSFLDTERDSLPPADPNGDLKSLAETINNMMEQDKGRIKSNYDSSKKQAQDMFDRTISALEDRLRIIDKERELIQDQIRKARRERDESVQKAEKERKEATAHLDSKKYNKMPLPPSTAPENLVSNEPDELEPPNELCCCITGDLMDDPVTAMDGHTYERSAIEAWYARFNSDTAPTSPLTNEALPSRRLIPSHNIRSQCKTWQEKLGIENEVIADPLAGITSSDRRSPPPRSLQRQESNRSRAMSSSEHSNSNGAPRRNGARPSSARRPASASGGSSTTRERNPGREGGRERVPSRRVSSTSGARSSLSTQRSASSRRLSAKS